MIDINVTKWPVIIYSNYRTGSTALGHYLSKKYNTPYFNEPFYRPNVMDEFLKVYNSGDSHYIIKFMADHIHEDDLYNQLLALDAYKIRLYRANKVEQITSYYVASMTKRWRTYQHDNVDDYMLPFDKDMMLESFRRIIYNDQLLDEANIDFDLTTDYESLGYLDDADLVLTKQPKNFDQLKQIVTGFMNSKFNKVSK